MLIELPVPFTAEITTAARGPIRDRCGVAQLGFRVMDLTGEEAPIALSAMVLPTRWASSPSSRRRAEAKSFHQRKRMEYRRHPSGELMRPLWLQVDGRPPAPITVENLQQALTEFREPWRGENKAPAHFLSDPEPWHWFQHGDLPALRQRAAAYSSDLEARANAIAVALRSGAAFVDGILHVPSKGPAVGISDVYGSPRLVVLEELGHVHPAHASLFFRGDQVEAAEAYLEAFVDERHQAEDNPRPAIKIRIPETLTHDTVRTGLTAMAMDACNTAEGWNHWLSMVPEAIHAFGVLAAEARHGQTQSQEDILEALHRAVRALEDKGRYGPCWMHRLDPVTSAAARARALGQIEPAPDDGIPPTFR